MIPFTWIPPLFIQSHSKSFMLLLDSTPQYLCLTEAHLSSFFPSYRLSKERKLISLLFLWIRHQPIRFSWSLHSTSLQSNASVDNIFPFTSFITKQVFFFSSFFLNLFLLISEMYQIPPKEESVKACLGRSFFPRNLHFQFSIWRHISFGENGRPVISIQISS